MLAVFILIVACINYMNLATARSGTRVKEIGLRKVFGAGRKEIINQFFGESFFSALLALLISLIALPLALPFFNSVFGKQLSFGIFDNLALALVLLTIIIGFISGIYPSLLLSSFQPVNVLKNINPGGEMRSARLRRILVIVQFTFSIFLIFGATVIYRQLEFVNNKSLGFNKERIVVVGTISDRIRNFEIIRQELKEIPGVVNVTIGVQPIWQELNPVTDINWSQKNPENRIALQAYKVDYDYVPTYGMTITDGRNFSREFQTDEENAVLLNETAVAKMELDSPVGTKIQLNGKEKTVIGIVKDFHHGSLHNRIQPVVMLIGRALANCIKIRPENMEATLASIEKIYSEAVPAFPYDYTFIDETIDRFYRNEQKMSIIITVFTTIAILIACLGLFGLSAFFAEKRTREIGVRKTLGASAWQMVLLLTGDFTKCVFIAAVVAWPIGWYAADRWLRDFAYRIEPGITTYLFSCAAALVIAIATISLQTVRAALKNPVDSLRYE